MKRNRLSVKLNVLSMKNFHLKIEPLKYHFTGFEGKRSKISKDLQVIATYSLSCTKSAALVARSVKRSPCMQKVGSSNRSRHRLKSLKQVVAAPLLNAKRSANV